MPPWTFLEFFAGGGMVREALGPRWRCLFANDFDPAKARSYHRRWGDGELLVGDVGELSPSDLPAERADLAWASFPCQDLSLAGAGAGLAGERSGSFMPFWLLMRRLRGMEAAPRIIVLENVVGWLTANGGLDFADVCRMLRLGGYRFGALVMDAADFVPQSRPRLFLVAVDELSPLPRIAGHAPVRRWHPPRLVSAVDALPPDIRRDWLWFDPPAPASRNVRLVDLIEHDPSGVPWHDAAHTERLLSMMTPLNRAKVETVAARGGFSVGTVYRRTRPDGDGRTQRAEVRFDDVAGCLRTPSGGSSRQTVLIVDDGGIRSRLLSARETARLMGLPDDYELPERYNDAYHLTGDGVVVPVVRHLAEHVLEPLLDRAGYLAVAAE